MDKPAMKLIGLAVDVTLYDVQVNQVTLELRRFFTVEGPSSR
ncbi:hypothetical protein J2T17_001574 [Paenibacillus mucilaginosus]